MPGHAATAISERRKHDMAMIDDPDKPQPGRHAPNGRAERLASQLRANLRRRKAQARGRANASDEVAATGKDTDRQSDRPDQDRS